MNRVEKVTDLPASPWLELMNQHALSRPDDPHPGHRLTEALHIAEVFGGEPGCIAQARALADHFLMRLTSEWMAVLGEHTRDDLMLAVSEMVTNADRYSHGPYLLELEGTARRMSVTVYDSSTALPVFYSPTRAASAVTAWRSSSPSATA